MNKKKAKSTQKQNPIPKEKIIETAILKLQEHQQADLESAKILSEYQFFDIAKTIIDKNIKSFNKEPIDFLEAITKYLTGKNASLIQKNEISTHKQIIKETKQYIKQIKKSLKHIKENLNETYLLYKNNDNFYIIDNTRLIFCLEELSQTLSLTSYHKESEECFNIKSKIELGIERYFIQKDTILKSFNETGQFELCDDITLIKVDQYFNIKPSINNIQTNDFTLILEHLKHLKKYNKKQFEKEFSKYLKLIEFFPHYIYEKEEYQKILSISKSINKDFTENIMDLIKHKKIIQEPYHTKTINKILELLK